MTKKNPFTLMYGIPAPSNIARGDQMNTILGSFLNGTSVYMYLLTGIRGSGKTVLMRQIARELSKRDDWVVVDLNAQGDLMSSLANKLYNHPLASKFLNGWKLSINLPHITLTKEKGETLFDPEIIVEEIVSAYARKGRKLLITIDEVNCTQEFRFFANAYQSLLGRDLPVYLLATGLKENIDDIINDNAMTFLSRAPKIELPSLSLPSVANSYRQIFEIGEEQAIQMAKLTNGYPFAYQVLGYLLFEAQDHEFNQSIINAYQSYLWNNGYNKFWTDLTAGERGFVIALAQSKDGTRKSILDAGIVKESSFSQCRRRLLRKGLIQAVRFDCLEFVLPCFREFVLYMRNFE